MGHDSRRPNGFDVRLEATRRLEAEELAELHLELGRPDRALRIYETLCAESPGLARHHLRCRWLRAVVKGSSQRPLAARRSVDRTLRGVRSPVARAGTDEPGAGRRAARDEAAGPEEG